MDDGGAAGPTLDGFLGGRVRLWQPRSGYRAGIDPVLLAAAVPARPGDRVLDLGCGVGAALFCLAARVPGIVATGVELQPDYAALAVANAAENGVEARIAVADVRDLPADLRQQSFDHVIANPPYFRTAARAARAAASNPGKEIAFSAVHPLAGWVEVAARRARPGGTVVMIVAVEQVPELLAALVPCGAVDLHPLAAREGADASRAILRLRKGGRAGFRLRATSVLHRGDRHLSDADSYLPEVSAILRDGQAWPWSAALR